MTEGRPASQSLWAGERSRVIGHVSYLVEKDYGEELRDAAGSVRSAGRLKRVTGLRISSACPRLLPRAQLTPP